VNNSNVVFLYICFMKQPKQKPFDIKELEKEYRILLQIDKIKAKEIKKKIDYFNCGIE